MEKEFYNNEFEQLLKEKADQFRMYPSKRVWHSIYNNLHPSRRWPSVVISLLLLTSLSFIGYLNTGDHIAAHSINNKSINDNDQISNIAVNREDNNKTASFAGTQQTPVTVYGKAFENVLINEPDIHTYTIVKSNRPDNFYTPASTVPAEARVPVENKPADKTGRDVIQDLNKYIKTNQLFNDLAKTTKKNNTAEKNNTGKEITSNTQPISSDHTDAGFADKNIDRSVAVKVPATDKVSAEKPEMQNLKNTVFNKPNTNKIAIDPLAVSQDKKQLTNEDKAWIEEYAAMNKPASKKWKDHLSFQFYATPAVNYRKLSTKSKGSVTAFANADINEVISQKPGFGMEAGAGVTYSFANNLQVKAGLQFNYTNYNIAADQTTHPILTTILLNDPITGVSYAAARTSTTANAYHASALKPVTLRNRTYQISLPVGLYYKLSSEQNVDWYAGASVQPTYVFGGNAHIISTDLKSYVSEPSSIRTWNLNLGFETYMNFKLGEFNLQVGPQVRYQVYSTYRKNVALIEKPYAVGLKFGLTKGF